MVCHPKVIRIRSYFYDMKSAVARVTIRIKVILMVGVKVVIRVIVRAVSRAMVSVSGFGCSSSSKVVVGL